MIYIVALITTQPGQRAAVLDAFKEIVPAVRAEQGCVSYQPVIDATGIGPFQAQIGPDSFMVVEQWESQEALTAHSGAPHMLAYGKRVKSLLASRTIHVLSPA